MLLQRFDGIVGTGWIIATGRRQQGRKRHLISTNEKNQQEFHAVITALLRRTLSCSVAFAQLPSATPISARHDWRCRRLALRESPRRASAPSVSACLPHVPRRRVPRAPAAAPCAPGRGVYASRGCAPRQNGRTAGRSLPPEGDAEGKRDIAPQVGRCEFASPEHGRPRDLLRASVATRE